MPATTWVEGFLALIFLVMVILALQSGYYLFLPFHAMLAFGYGLVFFTSFRSYSLGEITYEEGFDCGCDHPCVQ